VYEAKEQANLYLEKIKSTIKATNTTLLLFIPILALLLIEIQKHYDKVQQQVAGRNYRYNISKQQSNLNDSIKSKSEELSKLTYNLRLLKQGSIDSNLLKSEINSAKNKILGYIDKRKEYKKDIRRNIQKTMILNDSLKNQLEQLKIAVELPVLRRTESFSVRSAVVATMSLLTFFIWFLTYQRERIYYYLNKFIRLQRHASFQVAGQFHNYTINLPFWCFPISTSEFLNNEHKILHLLVGSNKNGLITKNLITCGILIMFLFLNIALCRMNWNINYKIFHQHYSFYNAISLFLLLVDISFIVGLTLPLFKINKVKKLTAAGMNRKQFVGLLAGSAGAFLFEPLYSRATKGIRWFYHPRFLNPKKNLSINLQTGFYIHNSRKKRVYYFNNNKAGILKTISKPIAFRNNLKLVKIQELISSPEYKQRIKQKDLLRYINSRRSQVNKIKLLENFLLLNPDEVLSLEFIDSYTRNFKLYRNQSPAKTRANQKIFDEINKIELNSLEWLPKKYRTNIEISNLAEKDRYNKVKEELIAQMTVRIQHWRNRIT
jgi:hypothetical protein